MNAAATSGMIAGAVALLLGVPLRAALTPRPRTLWGSELPAGSTTKAARWRGRRTRTSDATVVPCVIDLLDALAAEVRSGGALRRALEAAAVVGRARQRTADAVRCDIARAVLDAVDAPAGQTSLHPATAVAAQAITSALQLGGAQALALDSAATLLRERHAVAQERAAHSAQARLSARVMTVVPVAFTGWVLLTNAEARAATATPFGSGALTAGVMLNVTGWLWMRRIVRVRS